MRKAVPKLGATRIVYRFLFLPQTLYFRNSPDKAGTREITRWLEFAGIVQERVPCYYGCCLRWKNVAWADLSEAEVTALEWEAKWEDDCKQSPKERDNHD